MKGRDRNALCWCGSNKKFKKCHSGRENQPSEHPWVSVTANRKAFQQKKCCARDVGLSKCSGAVVKAHTVSRGPNLSKISEDGHVIQYTADYNNLKNNCGKLIPKKIGIKDASVFSGFCSNHDRELFSCIENEPFSGRPDQCLAVAYRTMSRELYGKDAMSNLRETLRGADKGKTPLQQLRLQYLLDGIDAGNEAARREQQATHNALTLALVENRTDSLRSLIIEFDGHLPFMFAGAWSPFTDIFAKKLQEGHEYELLEQVFFSSFSAVNGDLICISWRDVQNAPGKVIAEQIQALPLNKQSTACFQFVAMHIENIFFNPKWFRDNSDHQSKLIDQFAATGIDIMGTPSSFPISLEEEFGLPSAIRHTYV